MAKKHIKKKPFNNGGKGQNKGFGGQTPTANLVNPTNPTSKLNAVNAGGGNTNTTPAQTFENENKVTDDGGGGKGGKVGVATQNQTTNPNKDKGDKGDKGNKASSTTPKTPKPKLNPHEKITQLFENGGSGGFGKGKAKNDNTANKGKNKGVLGGVEAGELSQSVGDLADGGATDEKPKGNHINYKISKNLMQQIINLHENQNISLQVLADRIYNEYNIKISVATLSLRVKYKDWWLNRPTGITFTMFRLMQDNGYTPNLQTWDTLGQSLIELSAKQRDLKEQVSNLKKD